MAVSAHAYMCLRVHIQTQARTVPKIAKAFLKNIVRGLVVTSSTTDITPTIA